MGYGPIRLLDVVGSLHRSFPYFGFDIRVRFERVNRLAQAAARLFLGLQLVERNTQVLRDVNHSEQLTEVREALGHRLHVRHRRILLPEKHAEFV